MPFDAMVASKPTLAGFLLSEGIIPVPMPVLEKHKADQLRRYRRSLVLSPWPYVAVGVAALALMEYGAIISGSHEGAVTAPALALCVMFVTRILTMLVCTLADVQLRGGADWIELVGRWRGRKPASIVSLARSVHQRMPNTATLIYGELREREIVLDPYLLIEMDGERACLAIWDGEQIIATATVCD